MASYKVVYRDDAPAYQPGCVIQVVAVQVSRNIENAQCYLQVKARNVSSKTIGSIKIEAAIVSPDSKKETIELKSLDADVTPGCEIELMPALLKSTEVVSVLIRVSSADQLHDFPEPEEIQPQDRIFLSNKAESERIAQMEEAGVNPNSCNKRHRQAPNWWICQCGSINTDRRTCCKCNAPLDKLENWENQSKLEEQADRRAYNTACSKAKSNDIKTIKKAIDQFETLASEGYMDSEDQVSSAKRRLSELESEANRKKKIAIRTVCIAIMIALALALIIVFVVLPAQKQEALNAAAYQSAITKLDRGKYDDAKNAFKALGGYKDSSKLAKEAEEKAAAAKEEENRQRYQQGVKYMEEAQYDDAFLVFSSLKDYSDSKSKADEAKALRDIHPFSASIGSVVKFGKTEQDGNTSNGPEDIQWRILAKEGDSILVISCNVIDWRVYDSDQSNGVNFGSSELCAYLNGSFLSNSFSDSEKSHIIDGITILDKDSISKYVDKSYMKASGTTYALSLRKSTGPGSTGTSGAMPWCVNTNVTGYMASSGYNDWHCMVVTENGSMSQFAGGSAITNPIGIRPAMWVTA